MCTPTHTALLCQDKIRDYTNLLSSSITSTSANNNQLSKKLHISTFILLMIKFTTCYVCDVTFLMIDNIKYHSKITYLRKSNPAAYSDPFIGANAFSDNFANFNTISLFPAMINSLTENYRRVFPLFQKCRCHTLPRFSTSLSVLPKQVMTTKSATIYNSFCYTVPTNQLNF